MTKNNISNPYREYKAVKVKDPLANIRGFIGSGGLVPFEHGYKKPTFKHKGNEYVCSMVDETIAYCKKIGIGDFDARPCKLLLSTLGKPQLNKLYNELKKYELYCMYEA